MHRVQHAAQYGCVINRSLFHDDNFNQVSRSNHDFFLFSNDDVVVASRVFAVMPRCSGGPGLSCPWSVFKALVMAQVEPACVQLVDPAVLAATTSHQQYPKIRLSEMKSEAMIESYKSYQLVWLVAGRRRPPSMPPQSKSNTLRYFCSDSLLSL